MNKLKNILHSEPLAFKNHLIKQEETFFMNRATPKTREWAMNSMQAFIGYEEYSLNVLKKIIAKKVIELCLNNTELTKKNIPEIFCWDLAFIKTIQKKCIRAIHIHRIIDQTNLYFQKIQHIKC